MEQAEPILRPACLRLWGGSPYGEGASAEEETSSMNSREKDGALVADFLARGGHIRKVPDAVRVSLGRVVAYLRAQNVSVERISASGPPTIRKFLCDGQRVSEQTLVSIANGLRSEQGLPQFQLDLRSWAKTSSKARRSQDTG
jgi:hypothetical protein